jgi:hypothetical protein
MYFRPIPTLILFAFEAGNRVIIFFGLNKDSSFYQGIQAYILGGGQEQHCVAVPKQDVTCKYNFFLYVFTC